MATENTPLLKRLHAIMNTYRSLLAFVCISALMGCSHGDTGDLEAGKNANQMDSDDTWVGVYSSPAEIGGFSGTVLAIEKDLNDDLSYRMTFYSDVVSSNSISESEKQGNVLHDGDKLYVPEASGFYLNDKPHLLARIARYTRRTINGRLVLLRDDALQSHEKEDRLYDYGVLIKVADKVEPIADLEDVEHESIKVLYADPSKGWSDPFVKGPNKR